MDGDRPLRRSQVRSLRRTRIAAQEWIDCVQFESELPNYITRYLATVKDDIAVLVTLSAHKTTYSTLDSTFDAVINSLQLTIRPLIGKRCGVLSVPPRFFAEALGGPVGYK